MIETKVERTSYGVRVRVNGTANQAQARIAVHEATGHWPDRMIHVQQPRGYYRPAWVCIIREK